MTLRHLALAAALLAATPLGAQGYPDTPLGKRAAAIVATIQSGDSAAVRRFVAEHMDAEYRAMELAAHVDNFARLHRQLAGFTVGGVQARSRLAGSVTLRRDTAHLTIHLMLDPAPPHPITGLRIVPGAPAPSAPVAIHGFADLDSILAAATREDRFSGVVLASRGGKVVFEKAYGLADRERGRPNTTTTAFDVGSITKTFTAVAVLKLAQEGRLDLDAPLGRYLAGFPADAARRVTPRMLLQHRAGWGDFLNVPEFANHVARFTKQEDYVALARRQPLRFTPGAGELYGNTGYEVLGGIIEKVTGARYEEAIRDLVFRPAGMDSSGFFRRGSGERVANGYGTREGGAPRPNLPLLTPDGSASGGSFATAADLSRFLNAMAADRLLRRAYTDLLFNRFRPEPLPRRTRFGTFGGDVGVIAGAVLAHPARRDVVVILSNLDTPVAVPVVEALAEWWAAQPE